MHHLFADFDLLDPRVIASMIPIVALLVGAVAIVANVWLKHKKSEMNAALKQDMIQRGMSADDIIRVLEAGSKRPSNNDQRAAVSQETTDFKRS